MNTTIELIPTATYHAAGFAAESKSLIEKVLQDLAVAESWESMALRCVARSKPDRSRFASSPFATRRRAA